MTRFRPLVLLIASVVLSAPACGSKSGDTAGSSASPRASVKTASSSAPIGDGAASASSPFGTDSITLEWTGKYVDAEGEKQVPNYKVTNKYDKTVFYMKVWYYFYDASKKQIGRKFYERYSLNLKPGESKEMPLGQGKDAMVKGDIASIQAVVVGATYDGKGQWDGDVKTLAPEDRPMK